MCRILRKNGYNKIYAVRDGKSAISLVKKRSFDVVFLDLLMQIMNGEETFKQLKKIRPKMPVIFMSGQLDLEEEKLKKKGAFALIPKPFNLNKILELLLKL